MFQLIAGQVQKDSKHKAYNHLIDFKWFQTVSRYVNLVFWNRSFCMLCICLSDYKEDQLLLFKKHQIELHLNVTQRIKKRNKIEVWKITASNRSRPNILANGRTIFVIILFILNGIAAYDRVTASKRALRMSDFETWT